MNQTIRRQAWRMIYYIRTNYIANAVCMLLWVFIFCGAGVFLGMRPEQVELAHQWKGDEPISGKATNFPSGTEARLHC